MTIEFKKRDLVHPSKVCGETVWEPVWAIHAPGDIWVGDCWKNGDFWEWQSHGSYEHFGGIALTKDAAGNAALDIRRAWEAGVRHAIESVVGRATASLQLTVPR